MIISHKHKFIFIKTKKTAGTSIEIALSKLCGPNDIITPDDDEAESLRKNINVLPKNYQKSFLDYNFSDWKIYLRSLNKNNVSKKFYNHISALELKSIISKKIWDSYFKFCFERNPYDKAVSFYFHHLKTNSINVNELSFNDFINTIDYYKNFHRYSINNKVAVDFIGKYENLEDDLKQVFNKINVEFDGWLPKTKSKSREKSVHYSNYFTPKLKEIVFKNCEKEIDLFNYKFEDNF